MAQQQYIKYLYEVEERSLNEIHKITGYNYRTVHRYAYKEDWIEDHLPDVDPERYPVLGEFIPVIDQWLENDRKVRGIPPGGSMTVCGRNWASEAAIPA